jgi:crotonobetainyl-CoA:carnitine CoA-transferase CaiB-like acyl-CoA transferase
MAGKVTGPLEGVRVVELAHIMAGPVCGLMLADMGADVIKVERPEGDDTRRFLPPAMGDQSAAFLMMNRNKRGVALDLKDDADRAAFLDLVRDADILIENHRKGTMEKLGLGQEVLEEVNPALIHVEVSGFGRTGPYADRGGFDLIAQGMSGLMSITGEGAGRPPVKVGAPVSDITAGILAAMGALAAYIHRLKTGEGQRVDTSLFEAGIVQTYWQSAIALATGVAPGPMGSAHPLNAPYQAFATSDGWICVGAANQRNWERLLSLIDAPELGEDARFATNHDRMVNRPALEEALNAVFLERSTAEWLRLMDEGGLPAGPVLDVVEMHANEQTRAREMVVATDHPSVGRVETLGLPVKFSRTPGGVRRPAPLLAEHNAELVGRPREE